jgi:Uma2 family endonuclease
MIATCAGASRPIGPDSAIQIPNGNTRFPDFGVDCEPRNGKSMVTTAPAVVVEVLSPSTRFLDFNKKLDEYKSVSTLKYILLVVQDFPRVHAYRHTLDEQWLQTIVEGLEAIVKMQDLELSLSLATLYERIQFSF